MKLTKPSVTIINEPDMLKRIELAGRTCYKSEDRITPDSASKFVSGIIKRGHESVLEHSNLIVRALTPESIRHLESILSEYEQNTGLPSFIRHGTSDETGDRYDDIYGEPHFSGNARAWRNICKRYCGESMLDKLFSQHPLFSDIEFPHYDEDDGPCAQVTLVKCAPGDMHNIVTVRVVCDRGVSHELVRHRTQSFSQESTRYVSYGNGMKFISPWWFEDGAGQFGSDDDFERAKAIFLNQCSVAQSDYVGLIDLGAKPQLARAVLPNALKTEVVITGTIRMWKMWLELRDSPAVHPDMLRIAQLFKEATSIAKDGD